MLEIGNKLINKVNVDGQELTFTLVDFSDNEISGKIAVQGDFTNADDYTTNNQILNTLLSKHQVNQRSFNYLSTAIQISGLTTAKSVETSRFAMAVETCARSDPEASPKKS